MSTVSVVAAVVDTRQLTLYKQDGKTVSIPQGDPRLRKILDEITPIISQGGVANVNVAEVNVYQGFEEQTGGFARFFRVAKNKVAGFFGASHHETEQDNSPVEPVVVGNVPPLQTAIDEIIAHATPETGEAIKSNETVVAVVGSGADAKIIPGMENLKDQFTHALKLGSTKGVENFLKRISAVIDQRQHSIHDLLVFMERGDLPIADDGSIIIYKILKQRDGTFVDCHSGRVPQKVGSYVCMDPSLVDPDRRNECSNGLHVARRGYLGSFSGDVCVLAKVAPEDVIAVPKYDANKMRVCGYHIIFELDEKSFSKLKNNRPMTDNEGAQALLGRAISGDHIGKIEEVRITEQRGGGVIITPLNKQGQPARPKGPAPKVTALDDVASAPSVDPKAVAEKVTEAKSQAKAAPTNSRQQTARALFDEGDIQQLMTFKRKSKVSWASLGFNEEEQKHILTMAANPVPKPAPKPASKPAPTVKAPPKKAAPVKRSKPGTMSKTAVAKQEKLVSAMAPIVEAVPEHEEPTTSSGGTVKSRFAGLYRIYQDEIVHPGQRAKAAMELLALRKKAKKSWSALGYPKLTDQLLHDGIDRLKAAALAPAPTTGGPSQQAARALFNNRNWTGLQAFKKLKKKSWAALGFTSKEEAEIKLHIGD